MNTEKNVFNCNDFTAMYMGDHSCKVQNSAHQRYLPFASMFIIYKIAKPETQQLFIQLFELILTSVCILM